jgi:ABC-type Fe3+-hydroxamate transport system substrate-binding protein
MYASRLAAVAAPLFAFVTAQSIPPASAAPLEVTDALARKVTIHVAVERVVINFNFEEFTAVAGKEGWQKVVGMSRAPWESWRPAIFNRYKGVIPNLADMPDIGNSDDNNFSVEKVIALRPDVLLLSEWTYNSLRTGKEQIETAGIPIVVIDYNAQILERHLASTRTLGKVMGKEKRADELARLYESKYKDVMARVANAQTGRRPKVYVELGQAGADTVGNTYNGTHVGQDPHADGRGEHCRGQDPGTQGTAQRRGCDRRQPRCDLHRRFLLAEQAQGGNKRL